ncbi:uncharacterized protein LOC132726542 [Ruditapes philippinarum]|uniref:uncharacterized protein LOC132726542 n=1 Tax=Ruditapes philippinarum TaxID=129788 RepID=UPI00295A77B3|nr:uncharacterized protein LOC132726542 [Ruditapes philippinarum]
MVQEMGISSILFQAPSLPGQEVAYYRAQIESIVNSEVKFRIFLAPRADRLLSVSLEPMAYEAVKTHFESNLPSRYFKLSTLSVRSTVMCASSQVVENGKTLTFNAIKIGETGFSWERCYPNNKAYATSTCRGGYDDGATFREIKIAENCGEVPVYNESESTVTLRNLSQTVITEENYKTVLSNTANLTNPDVNLTAADIIYTAEILYNYLQFDTVNTPEVSEIHIGKGPGTSPT